MARFHVITNATTGETTQVQFTAAEELAADTPIVVDYAAIDQGVLNEALAAEGSVVRALALLTLQEINNLRTRAGLTAYTMTQFTTALKAKMRT